jgi:hypothetical protein
MDLVSLIHSLEFQETKLKELNPVYRNYFHRNLYDLCAFNGNTSELQSFCEKLQKELYNLNHSKFKSHYGKVFFREMLWAIKSIGLENYYDNAGVLDYAQNLKDNLQNNVENNPKVISWAMVLLPFIGTVALFSICSLLLPFTPLSKLT